MVFVDLSSGNDWERTKTKDPPDDGSFEVGAKVGCELVGGSANVAMLANSHGGVAVIPRAIRDTVQNRCGGHSRNRNHAIHAASLVGRAGLLVAKASRRNTGG